MATPLGNLGDISQRALAVLAGVDVVACEDTRHARHLLEHYDIKTRLLALHQHNEAGAAEKLATMITGGQRIALISDAGTPGISDPGARTVAAVLAAGCKVVPLPGPSAAITALSAAGMSEERFLFVGFLPAKVGARKTALEGLKTVEAALVIYEAPHRIAETLADIAGIFEGDREIVIARELTKLFEQIVRMPVREAVQWLASDPNHARGEFVLLLSGPPARDPTTLLPEAERILSLLLAELPVKQAAKLTAQITGESKNSLYARALALKTN